MRTTTPAATCWPITACGESITSADELDAAVDRAGVHEHLARARAAGRRSGRRPRTRAATARSCRSCARAASAARRRRRPRRARRAVYATLQPSDSIPRGISVGGPQTVTSAPSFVKARMFERATRECMTSPTIQIVQPVERAEPLAQRVDVEQRLRGVLVLAVAGVDDRGVDPAGDERGRADVRRADDDQVRAGRR